EGLYARSEDANDHNLPLMVWYGAEPMVEQDPGRALDMSLEAQLPNILPYTIKRAGAIGTQQARRALEETRQELQSKPHSTQYHQARQELDQLLGKAE